MRGELALDHILVLGLVLCKYTDRRTDRQTDGEIVRTSAEQVISK